MESDLVSGNYKYVVYNDLTDEELIKLSHNGDYEAVEYICCRYEGVLRKIISTFYIIGAEREDLMQEAMISLYKAIQEYNPDKNCSFKSYASVCIKRHIITVIRRSTRLKHNPLNNYVSFNLLSYEDKEVYLLETFKMDSVKDPETIVVLKEREYQIIYKVNKYLSKFEKQVLSCYYSGMSYVEASSVLNKDVKAIDNALQRIKRKMKNELDL